MVTTAVQSAAAARRRHGGRVEVDEVDQQLRADAADEALWMPVTVRAGTRRSHRQLAGKDHHTALATPPATQTTAFFMDVIRRVR